MYLCIIKTVSLANWESDDVIRHCHHHISGGPDD